MRYELNFESELLGGSAELDYWGVPWIYMREEGVEPACREYKHWLQKSLNKIQNQNLVIDGEVGVNTNKAIRAFRKEHGLGDSTKIDMDLEVALVRAGAMLPPTSYPPAMPGAAGRLPWIRGLLPLLEKYRGDIPLYFLLGWIDVETGGCVGDISKKDERGYFQIHPEELSNLRLDGQPIDPVRLASDYEYSVRAGIELVRYYMNFVATVLKIARGTDLFWRMVKFQHTGRRYVQIILEDMRKHSAWPTSWDEIKNHVLNKDNNARLRENPRFEKRTPESLLENVDKLMRRGVELASGITHGATPALFLEAATGGNSEFDLNFEAESFQGYAEFDGAEGFDSEAADEWSEEVRRRRGGRPPARRRVTPRLQPRRRRPVRSHFPALRIPFASLNIFPDMQAADMLAPGDPDAPASATDVPTDDAAGAFAADQSEFYEWEWLAP